MTDRQQLIARKAALQSAKNKLRGLSGVCVLEIYEGNRKLDKLYLDYAATYGCIKEPRSRLPFNCSKEDIVSWIIDIMGLKEQKEYFIFCGVWGRIKISDLHRAVSSMWECEKNCHGFLLAEGDLSRIMECGSDSRDEENYLIDLWKNPSALC